MPTTITGEQIRDDSVKREDLNTTIVGKAVIRKLLQAGDSSITISSTGVDNGTGDVTVTHAIGNGWNHIPVDGNVSNILIWKAAGESVWNDLSYPGLIDCIIPSEDVAIAGMSNITVITPYLLNLIIRLNTIPYYGALQDVDLGLFNISATDGIFTTIKVGDSLIYSTTQNETPSGIVDGINKTFTLSHAFVTGSTEVFLNGVKQILGIQYTESSPNIVFVALYVPETLDTLRVNYNNA